MIKTIFFDLDDTLLWDKKSVKQAFIETCQIAEKKHQINPSQLEEAVRNEARRLYATYPTYEFTQMIGINPFEGLWGNFLDDHEQFKQMSKIVPSYRRDAWTNGLKNVGIDDPEFGQQLTEEFPKQRKKNPFVFKDTFHVLKSLEGSYQLVMLTNGSPDLQNTKLSITPELKTYFDHIVISGDFGRGKPDPLIFEYAAKLSQTDKSDIIMVGDNLNTDILGSNRAGIKNVWINHEGLKTDTIQPTYEIKYLHELLPLLEKIN